MVIVALYPHRFPIPGPELQCTMMYTLISEPLRWSRARLSNKGNRSLTCQHPKGVESAKLTQSFHKLIFEDKTFQVECYLSSRSSKILILKTQWFCVACHSHSSSAVGSTTCIFNRGGADTAMLLDVNV